MDIKVCKNEILCNKQFYLIKNYLVWKIGNSTFFYCLNQKFSLPKVYEDDYGNGKQYLITTTYLPNNNCDYLFTSRYRNYEEGTCFPFDEIMKKLDFNKNESKILREYKICGKLLNFIVVNYDILAFNHNIHDNEHYKRIEMNEIVLASLQDKFLRISKDVKIGNMVEFLTLNKDIQKIIKALFERIKKIHKKLFNKYNNIVCEINCDYLEFNYKPSLDKIQISVKDFIVTLIKEFELIYA